jgi:hypothetical protein
MRVLLVGLLGGTAAVLGATRAAATAVPPAEFVLER